MNMTNSHHRPLSPSSTFGAALIGLSLAASAVADLPAGFKRLDRGTTSSGQATDWRIGAPSADASRSRILQYLQVGNGPTPRWKYSLWTAGGIVELGDYWGAGDSIGTVAPVAGKNGGTGVFNAWAPPVLAGSTADPANLTMWACGTYNEDVNPRAALVRSVAGKPRVILIADQGLPWVGDAPFRFLEVATDAHIVSTATPPVTCLEGGDVIVAAKGSEIGESSHGDRFAVGLWRVSADGTAKLLLTDRMEGPWGPTLSAKEASSDIPWKLVGEPRGTKWIVAYATTVHAVVTPGDPPKIGPSIHPGFSMSSPTEPSTFYAARLTNDGDLVAGLRDQEGRETSKVELPQGTQLAAIWPGSGDRLYIAGISSGQGGERKVAGVTVRSESTPQWAIWSLDGTGTLRQLQLPRPLEARRDVSKQDRIVRVAGDAVSIGDSTGLREVWTLGLSAATSVCKVGDQFPAGKLASIRGAWADADGDFLVTGKATKVLADPPQRVENDVCIGGSNGHGRELFSRETLERGTAYNTYNLLEFGDDGTLTLELVSPQLTWAMGTISVRNTNE